MRVQQEHTSWESTTKHTLKRGLIEAPSFIEVKPMSPVETPASRSYRYTILSKQSLLIRRVIQTDISDNQISRGTDELG